jgi:hypothetical protein
MDARPRLRISTGRLRDHSEELIYTTFVSFRAAGRRVQVSILFCRPQSIPLRIMSEFLSRELDLPPHFWFSTIGELILC